jgi:hypothetical protein
MLDRQLAGVPWDGRPRLFTIHALGGGLLMRPVRVSPRAWEGRTPGEAIIRLAAGWEASPPVAAAGELRGAAVVFDDQAVHGLRPPVPGHRARPRRAAAAARAMVAVGVHPAPYGVIQSRGAPRPRRVRVDPRWEVPGALDVMLAALQAGRGGQAPAPPVLG